LKKVYKISILLFLGLLLNSCGILFNKNPNRIYFNSNPDSAKVYLNDSLLGVTPVYIEFDSKNKNYKFTLSKDGFENRNFIVEQSMNYLPFFLDVIWGFPMLVTYLSGYDYKHYITKNDYIFLKSKDSLNKSLKRDFGNNFIMVEGAPLVSFVGAFLTLSTNYYREIYKIKKNEESLHSLGVKGGWGWGFYGFLDDNGYEGFGYNIMPSYSYERFTDFDDYQEKSCKYIFSLGASYYQRIINPAGYSPGLTTFKRGFQPSFSFQNITMYYDKKIFWGYSLGRVNALNYFQFTFGIRF
jgi:hypothetical protein